MVKAKPPKPTSNKIAAGTNTPASRKRLAIHMTTKAMPTINGKAGQSCAMSPHSTVPKPGI